MIFKNSIRIIPLKNSTTKMPTLHTAFNLVCRGEFCFTMEAGQETTNTTVKRRNGKRRTNGLARYRDAKLHLELCHINSLFGSRICPMEGNSQATFEFYLGEHQSQIFYGGINIESPSITNGPIRVELGRSVPIDLSSDAQYNLSTIPCLAVPTHIFRRFRSTRIIPSDLKPGTCVPSPHTSNGINNNKIEDTSDSRPITPNVLAAPKSGLSLISIRAYFPVQYMQTANELQPVPGCRKRVHLPPHRDEVVAFPNILTMPVSEFVSRVVKGVANASRLRECSSELPASLLQPLVCEEDGNVITSLSSSSRSPNTNDDDDQRKMKNASFPYYRILPVSTYNRISSSKRMLLEGFRRPKQPGGSLGWNLSVSNLTSSLRPLPPYHPSVTDDNCHQHSTTSEILISWSDVVGVNSLTPPLPIVGSLGEHDKVDVSAEIRIVFVRRQSTDAGCAISHALRKPVFGPARIRRTRMKGVEGGQMVMQLKQLFNQSESTASGDEKASTSNDSDSNNTTASTNAAQSQLLKTTASSDSLQYKYFWSSDFRNGAPGVSTVNLYAFGRRYEQDGEGELTSRAASMDHPSSVTNGSTDEEDNRSIAERWHRPIRSCLPPQRLEVVDRDLEKALQRSLADGRRTGSYLMGTSAVTSSLKTESVSVLSSSLSTKLKVPRRPAVRPCQPNRTVGRVGRSVIVKKLAAAAAAAAVQNEIDLKSTEVVSAEEKSEKPLWHSSPPPKVQTWSPDSTDEQQDSPSAFSDSAQSPSCHPKRPASKHRDAIAQAVNDNRPSSVDDTAVTATTTAETQLELKFKATSLEATSPSVNGDGTASKSKLEDEFVCSPRKISSSSSSSSSSPTFIPKLTLAKSQNGHFSVRVISNPPTIETDPYELPDDPSTNEDLNHPPTLTDIQRHKRPILTEEFSSKKKRFDRNSPEPPVLVPASEEGPVSSQREASPILIAAPLPTVSDHDDDNNKDADTHDVIIMAVNEPKKSRKTNCIPMPIPIPTSMQHQFSLSAPSGFQRSSYSGNFAPLPQHQFKPYENVPPSLDTHFQELSNPIHLPFRQSPSQVPLTINHTPEQHTTTTPFINHFHQCNQYIIPQHPPNTMWTRRKEPLPPPDPPLNSAQLKSTLSPSSTVDCCPSIPSQSQLLPAQSQTQDMFKINGFHQPLAPTPSPIVNNGFMPRMTLPPDVFNALAAQQHQLHFMTPPTSYHNMPPTSYHNSPFLSQAQVANQMLAVYPPPTPMGESPFGDMPIFLSGGEQQQRQQQQLYEMQASLVAAMTAASSGQNHQHHHHHNQQQQLGTWSNSPLL